MKKYFVTLLMIASLFMASNVFAAAGSCVQGNVYFVTSTGEPPNDFRVLEFNCTFGTAGDATTALTSAVTTANMNMLKGTYLLMGTTTNGATAPTDQYDIYLKATINSVADKLDILGAAGENRPGTANITSQFTPNTSTSLLSSKPRPVIGNLTLTVSGNSVASGNSFIQFIFVK